MPVSSELLREVTKVAAGDEIVLCSDGYHQVRATLEEAEAEVLRIVEADPLFISEHRGFRPLAPGAVSWDDRAYLRFVA